jgi:TM2 domain-containing membrane protein YozV
MRTNKGPVEESFGVAALKPMRCSYHSTNAAVVDCSRCARPLCPACDHRIRGFPYCQDCIVAGVEMLQSRVPLLEARQSRPQTSPWVALLLSFVVPGLGSAYNGQTSKALVHFALFASCIQFAAVTNALAFFVLAAVGVWFFAAVDAFRTAQLIRAGLAPDAEMDSIARRLYGHPTAWAVLLVALGALFFLNSVMRVRLPVRQMLPAVLVLLGAYMLFDYLRRGARRTRGDAGVDNFPHAAGAHFGGTSFRTGELSAQIAERRRNDTFPPRV